MHFKNYRQISLPAVAYKVFTTVIGNSTREALDFNYPGDQAGFRKGYTTIDYIDIINPMIEK